MHPHKILNHRSHHLNLGARALEWDPNERDAWVADAQRWIGQIKGVLQCKIDLDDRGEIAGVHVVAGLERDPRHIVRDVESLLKARLQMDVYYKKIGVVQVVDSGLADRGPADRGPVDNGLAPGGMAVAAQTAVRAEVPAPSQPIADPSRGVRFLPPRGDAGAHPTHDAPTASWRAAAPDVPQREPQPAILVAEDSFPRLVCLGVSLMSSDRSVRAEVRLGSGGQEATGVAEGPNHADSDVHCIATAAVDAVAGLLALPLVLHLREVRLDTLGGQPTILVAVDLVESRRTETLLGACPARHNRQQAIVHAVLAALNRRLGLFALREAAAEA